jgi:hypothetical protein
MSQYGLFEKIPSSLFSPLAAQHAAVYSEVLLVLFAETQRHQEPLSRELVITLVMEVLESIEEIEVLTDPNEEQSTLDHEDQGDIRNRAGMVLHYLVDCRWLHEEIQSDFSVIYTLPDYAFRILSVFDDLTTNTKAPLQGLIYTIHDLLQAAVREGDERHRISQAHRETMHLLNALKELQHNIGVHIEIVLRQTKPKEVLEQAFGAYLHEITRRAYHELRTTDHVSRFRRSIQDALLELGRRDYSSTSEVTVRQNDKTPQNHHAQQILEQLQDIRDQFDRLDGLLHAIDSRHSQFFESAIRSIEHTLLASSTTSGHLRTILTYLLDPHKSVRDGDEAADTPLDGDLDQLISYYELSFLDGKSLAPVRRTREVFTPDLQNAVPPTDEEIRAAQEETLAQMFRAVSRARVRKFAEDLLQGRDERCADDFPLVGVEDLPLLIYLKVYGNGSLGYVFEAIENAEKIERNNIGFRNFRIRRR